MRTEVGAGASTRRESALWPADAVVRATRLQPNTQLDAAVDRQRDVTGRPLCNEQMREDERRESREERERDPNNVQRSCNGGARRERRAICCLERRLVGGRKSTCNK